MDNDYKPGVPISFPAQHEYPHSALTYWLHIVRWTTTQHKVEDTSWSTASWHILQVSSRISCPLVPPQYQCQDRFLQTSCRQTAADTTVAVANLILNKEHRSRGDRSINASILRPIKIPSVCIIKQDDYICFSAAAAIAANLPSKNVPI